MAEKGTIRRYWNGSLVTSFPGLIPPRNRLELILDEFRSNKSFYISRTNVLGDTFEIFASNDHNVILVEFTFIDEVGHGAGVIKEVYSILSQ